MSNATSHSSNFYTFLKALPNLRHLKLNDNVETARWGEAHGLALANVLSHLSSGPSSSDQQHLQSLSELDLAGSLVLSIDSGFISGSSCHLPQPFPSEGKKSVSGVLASLMSAFRLSSRQKLPEGGGNSPISDAPSKSHGTGLRDLGNPLSSALPAISAVEVLCCSALPRLAGSLTLLELRSTLGALGTLPQAIDRAQAGGPGS